MKDRIKELRKKEGLTQKEFAERLGIKRNTIAGYETGRNEPIDAVISLICREFHVREAWLRYGDGEMREPMTRKEAITRFFDECSTLPHDDFRAVIIDYLASTDANGWALLERELRRLAALLPEQEEESQESIIDRQVAEYRRQLELEARQMGKLSVSPAGKTGT